MEDNHNFKVNCLAYLVPAFPELGTAQPQLVMVSIMLTRGGGIYVRVCHTFNLFFTRLEIILKDGINFVYSFMFLIKQIFDFVTSFR